VVVIESGSRGGSMHTVREAEQRGRPVLAVPGPVTSAASHGTNDLLADGCAPCRSVDDLLTALDLVHAGAPAVQGAGTSAATTDEVPPGVGHEAARVLEVVGWDALPLDVVVTSTGLTLVTALAAVEELCDAGILHNDGGVLERKVRMP
jgi:DNA processing protein